MKDKQFLKLIEHAYPDKKQAMYQDLKKELGLPDDPVAPVESRSSVTAAQKPASKRRNFFKRPAGLIACISAALVVICSSIVFPIVLGKGEKAPSLRYRSADDCIEIQLEYSLKEYSESYLYIDWYDIAEEVQTKLFVDAEKTDELIYVQESMVNGETGSIAVLKITDLYTKVDVLESYWETCVDEVIINGISIYRGSNYIVSNAYFEYGNYRYFINLIYPLNEDSILELIEAMLP